MPTPDTPPRAVANADDPGIAATLRIQTFARVWAIHPRILAALVDLDGHELAATEAQQNGKPERTGEIATVPLQGVLMPSIGGLFALLFGGTGLASFQRGLADAAADPSVRAVVLDVDSPGGMVDQIPETAAQIRAVRAQKPIVAVANTQADSAAYWLASQADEIVVTPSGEVGSIGVYQMHRDLSAAHAMRGVAPTLVSAGKYKVEGNPYEPLGAEARAAMQADVDDYYAMFTAEVAKGRGADQSEVQQGYGEGRSLHARQAVAAGLADRVGTLQETVRRLASPRGRAALDQKRAEHELAVPELDAAAIAAAIAMRSAPAAYTPEERHRLLAVLAD